MHDFDSKNPPAGTYPEGNPLIAAADYLRAGTAAMRQSGQSRRSLFEEEKTILRRWCLGNGCKLNHAANL
jgi:hypothetical protein